MDEKKIERSSSINLSRNSKGIYTWDIKIYYDANEDENSDKDTINKIELIDKDLKERYVIK